MIIDYFYVDVIRGKTKDWEVRINAPKPCLKTILYGTLRIVFSADKIRRVSQ